MEYRDIHGFATDRATIENSLEEQKHMKGRLLSLND